MNLNLHWPQNYSEDSFVIGNGNCESIKWLDNLLLLPQKQILLTGPSYSGKTHLCKIWSLKYYAQFINKNTKEIMGPCVVDQMETMSEEDVKRIFCYAKSFGFPVVWVANHHPQFSILDLRTRFRSIQNIKIDEPDDVMFKKILMKKLNDFGIDMPSEIVEYIEKRSEITYNAINRISTYIHNSCLVSQKPISFEMMRDFLQVD